MRPPASCSASTSRSRRSPVAVRVFTVAGDSVPVDVAEKLTDREVATDLPHDLAPGTYTVAWRVVSVDSHPLRGAFVFAVGEPAG